MAIGEDDVIEGARDSANAFADLIEFYFKQKQISRDIANNNLDEHSANKYRDAHALNENLGVGVYNFRSAYNWLATKFGAAPLLDPQQVLEEAAATKDTRELENSGGEVDGEVHVSGYTKDDGTEVRDYVRSKPVR